MAVGLPFVRSNAALAAGILALFALPAIALAVRAAGDVPSGQRVVQAAPFTPTLSISIHNAEHDALTSVVVGTGLHARVRVTGSATTPTGVVRASWYASDDCGEGFGGSADLTLVDGVAHFVAAYRPYLVGTNSVRIEYKGSGLYNPKTACRTFTVTKATPRIFLTLHNNGHDPLLSTVVGQQVHGKATVTSDYVKLPTGGVKFLTSNAADCSSSATLDIKEFPAGTATVESKKTSFPTKSVVYFRAVYTGDANYKAVNSSCVKLPVAKATPTITLRVHGAGHDPMPFLIPVNTPVHPFVQVTGVVGGPDGTAEVHRYGNADCTVPPTVVHVPLKDGVFDATLLALETEESPGDIGWKVVYPGNASYLPKSSACLTLHWRAKVTALIDAHNASHAPLDAYAAGTPVHVLVALSGQFGTVDGTVEIRSFGDGACRLSADPQSSGSLALTGGVVDSGLFTRTRSTTGQISFQVIYQSASASKYLVRAFPCYTVSFIGPTATAGPTTGPAASGSAPAATPIPPSTLAPGVTASPGAASPGSSSPAATAGEPGAATSGPSGAAGAPATNGPNGTNGTPGPQASPDASPSSGEGLGSIGPLLLLVLIVVVLVVAGSFYLGRRSRGSPGV